MLNVTVTTSPDSAALQRWAQVFRGYAARNKRDVSELIAKKGRDLGIKLYDGFKDVQYGGDPKRRGIAKAELAARSAAGRGTRVRPELLKRYQSARKDLGFSVRSFGQAARYADSEADRTEARRDGRAARKRRAALWQKIVGAEIALRQSGIGVLAASFLMFRKRSNNARGTFTMPNRTGHPLGSVTTSDDGIEIASYATGIGQVEQRYGISSAALDASAADMLEYLRERNALYLIEALNGKAAA